MEKHIIFFVQMKMHKMKTKQTASELNFPYAVYK